LERRVTGLQVLLMFQPAVYVLRGRMKTRPGESHHKRSGPSHELLIKK
jgi:hypothetical protein